MVLAVYLTRFVVARIAVNALAVLIYVALTAIAVNNKRRTERRIATRAEWDMAAFSPWGEAFLLVIVVFMLFGSFRLLRVQRTDSWAQVWQMLSLITAAVRGAVCIAVRHHGYQSLWGLSKKSREG